MSFDVADGEAARRVETATRVITNATSLGGVHSVMESRHRWEADRVPEGLRLSVGPGIGTLDDLEAARSGLRKWFSKAFRAKALEGFVVDTPP